MLIAETLIPTYPNLTQLLGFSAIGFLVVMFVLLIQSWLTSLIGRIFISWEKNKGK